MEEQFYISEVKVGQKVENFVKQALLPDGTFGEVSLEQNMKEGKWTILFFWPLDFTFVCPTEILAMSEQVDTFAEEDTVVFGCSTDSVHSHLAWTKADPAIGGIGQIKFPMLEDTNHTLSEQFGVLIEDEGVALRGLFIINPEGVLESAIINNNTVGRSVDEVTRTLQAFKSGGLCPANWRKGDKTL